MSSIVDYEPQRRRRVDSDPSHTGVDDRHVGRGREARMKQSHYDESTYADESNRHVHTRVEYHGTDVKRTQHSVRPDRDSDEYAAEGRSSRSTKQGGSKAVGSRSRLQLQSMTRNNQPRESSRTSSRMQPNYKATTTARSHDDTIRSLSNELSHRSKRSSASSPMSRSSARPNYSSRPSDKSPKKNPNSRVPREDTRLRSREDHSLAWATPADSSTVGSPSRAVSKRRVTSPAPSRSNARNKQVSKSPGKQSKLNRTVCPEGHVCPGCASKHDGSKNAFGSNSSLRSKEAQNKNVLNRRSVRGHGEKLKTPSRRDLEACLLGNGTRRLSESKAESASTLSLPSTSSVNTRNSIVARDRLNQVYPDRRYNNGPHYADGDESSQASLDLSAAMDKVVDSIRSTAREILSSDGEDVWMSRAALNGNAESKKASVDTLIGGVFETLDDLEESLFGPTEETSDVNEQRRGKPAKSWFPKVKMNVVW